MQSRGMTVVSIFFPFFFHLSCVQVGVLKQEVLELNQQLRRQNVPPEYLKEVVVRYILSTPVSGRTLLVYHAVSFQCIRP